MHVRADSSQTAAEVRTRLADLGSALALDVDRQPQKLFLRSSMLTFPPAAEFALQETNAGSSVVLRLMWGPLPAPFPRVLAALGVLLVLAVLLSGAGPSRVTVGALGLAILPIAALNIQQRGERRIQSELTRTLGVGAFRPMGH